MSFLKPFSVAACLAVSTLPTLAQDVTSAAILASLSHVPAALFSQETPWRVEFGDANRMLQTATEQLGRSELAAPAPIMALGRSLPGEMRNVVRSAQDGGLEDAIGIGPADILTVLSVTNLPIQANVITLAEGRGATLVQGLRMSDYGDAMRGDTEVLWRGEEDFAINIRARNAADPFGGSLGRSSRVAILGDTAFQAPDWPGFEAMLAEDGSTSLAQDPTLRAIVLALDHEGAGLDGVAFAYVHQLPDGSAIMAADMIDGLSLAGLLALTAPDTAAAESLAATMRRNWTEALSLNHRVPYATVIPGEPVISVVPGTPAVAMIRIDGQADLEDPLIQNPIANRFMQMIWSDDLGPLTTP